MLVKFNPQKHQYHDEEGLYISVTQLIGRYKNDNFKDEEQREQVAKEYINNHPEYPMSLEQCLYAWDFLCDIALEEGNKYHNRKELENLWLSCGLQKGYVEELDDLYNLESRVYPELRLYNKKLRLAGHADKIDIDNNYFDIEDYKTYKDTVSKKGFKGGRMKYPLDFLPDSNFYHAALQLNIYAFLLEQFGYKCRSLKIHHKQFPDDRAIPKKYQIPCMSEEELRKPIIYPIKYNKRIVLILLEDYLKNKVC